MSAYEHWSLVWAAISAIATASALVVVAIAAVFTFQQVRESTRARQLESALAILTHASTPDLRNARRLLYTKHAAITQKISTNPPWSELDAFFKEISDGCVDVQCFHSYLASLENISGLVLHDLAPDDIIDLYFAPRAIRHWEYLSPFIGYMRQIYGSADYLQHFEMFVDLVRQGGLDVQRDFDIPFIPLTPSQQKKQTLLRARRRARANTMRPNT